MTCFDPSFCIWSLERRGANSETDLIVISDEGSVFWFLYIHIETKGGRMSFLGKFVFGVGIIALITGLVLGVVSYTGNSAKAEIVESVESVPVNGAHREVLIIPVTGTSTPEEIIPTATATPTAMPLVTGYVLGETVDLSSKAPVAMTFQLADGRLMSTNWAGTVSQTVENADDLNSVFAPSEGVIFSYLGDVLATYAHSGTGVGGSPYFFATNLDFYIRKTAENKTVSLPEALAKAETLRGITVSLCQAPSGTVAYLADHDANSVCPGEEIELELVAVAVIPHEMMPEYNLAVYDIGSWMSLNFPDSGFDKLTRDNGWLISFCVGRFSDQADDGTPWYSHNAGVIGLKVKDGE